MEISNEISHTNGKLDLRKIDDVPELYRSIFANYPHFNFIQSAVYNDVFYSDESIVVSAPTGSGKTTIFELAVVKLLLDYETSNSKDFKIIYISPTKALCEERLIDWHKKFSQFNVSCACVTGDNPDIDVTNLKNTNVIITTPEKWDSLTRRWRDNEKLVRDVKLFMIDEIHLLNDETRGSTLEAIVTRMKTVHLVVNRMNLDNRIRFIGVSATISNPHDIAEWLGITGTRAKYFKFDDNMRPVKLQKIVQGYPYNPSMSSPFKFDIMLSYKLHTVLLQHSAGKPSLIFCSTRKSVEMTCKQLVQNLTINLSPEGRDLLVKAANSLEDAKIKEVLIHGIASHHAGMLPADRRIVENLFREGNLPVLVTTSTLAMGVNLPAHLVVIKSTKYYANGEYKDYSASMLFQMIGRAGRPQFDTSATAVIMTTAADKHKYENMISGEQPVESSLHKALAEHVNAEVVLRTITDLGIAMQWLSSTFLYIRARKNPKHYGLPLGLSNVQLDKKLLDMCQIEINKLTKAGMLTMDQNVTISPTSTGYLMARYCVALDTMKLFTQVSGKEGLQQILGLISNCREFADIRLRTNDKRPLNILNQNRNKKTIRFPLSGKIKTLDMKINCIIQAVLGSLEISESSLIVEAQRIMRIGERLLHCLSDYLADKEKCYKSLLSSVTLAKCFHARIWENSPYVSKQLEGIGVALSNLLVTAEKTTFAEILGSNPRDLERIIGKKPPTGNKIQDQVKTLPQYSLRAKEVISDDGGVTVEVTIILENHAAFEKDITVNPDNVMSLVIGDSENNLLCHEKYTHMYMIQNTEIHRSVAVTTTFEHDIFINFISEDWVGIDVQTELKLFKSDEVDDAKPVENLRSTDLPDSTNGNVKPSASVRSTKRNKLTKSHMLQQLMDQYFKKVKVAGDAKAITRRKSIGQIKRKPSATITSKSMSENKNNAESKASNAIVTPAKSSKTISSSQDQITLMNGEGEFSKFKETRGVNDDNNSISYSLDKKDRVDEEIKTKLSVPITESEKDNALEKLNINSKNSENKNYCIDQIDRNQLVQCNNSLATIVNNSIKAFNNQAAKRLKTNLHEPDKITDTSDIIPATPSSSRLKFPSSKSLKVQLKGQIQQLKLERRILKAEELVQNPNDIVNFDQFVKQPKKKLTQSESSDTVSKKNGRQDMNQNDHKTLTWSSPLVNSPKLKYSPQLWKQNKENSNAKRKLPSLQNNIRVSGISDKDCNPNSNELHLTDVVSESFWDSIGIKINSQGSSGNVPLETSIANMLGREEIKIKNGDLNQTVSSTSSGCTISTTMPKMKTVNSTAYYSEILNENKNSKQQPQMKCVASQTEDEAFVSTKPVNSDGIKEIIQKKQKGVEEHFGNIELEKKSINPQQYLPQVTKKVRKLDESMGTNKSLVDMLEDVDTQKSSFTDFQQSVLSDKSKQNKSHDASMIRNNSWEEAFLASDPSFEDDINNVNSPTKLNASFNVANTLNGQENFFHEDNTSIGEINNRIWNKTAQNGGIPIQNKPHNQDRPFKIPCNSTMTRRISKNNHCTRQIPHDQVNVDEYYPKRQEIIPRIPQNNRSPPRDFYNSYGTSNIQEFPDNINDLPVAISSNRQAQYQNTSNHKMYNASRISNHQQSIDQRYPATFNNFEGYSSSRSIAEKQNDYPFFDVNNQKNVITNYQTEMVPQDIKPHVNLSQNQYLTHNNKYFSSRNIIAEKQNDYPNFFDVNNQKNVNTNFPTEMIPQDKNPHRNIFQNQYLTHNNKHSDLNDDSSVSRFSGMDHMGNINNPLIHFKSFNSNLPSRHSTPLSYENVGSSAYFKSDDKTGHFNDIPNVDNADYFDIDRNVTYHESYFDGVDKRGFCNTIDKIEPAEERYHSLENYPVREPFLRNNTRNLNSYDNSDRFAYGHASNMNMNGQQSYRKNLTFQDNYENLQNVRYKNNPPFTNYSLNNNPNNNVNFKNQYLLSRYFDNHPKQQTVDINRQVLNLNHTITSENQFNLLNDN